MTASGKGPETSEWAADKKQTSVMGPLTTRLLGQPQGAQEAAALALGSS